MTWIGATQSVCSHVVLLETAGNLPPFLSLTDNSCSTGNGSHHSGTGQNTEVQQNVTEMVTLFNTAHVCSGAIITTLSPFHPSISKHFTKMVKYRYLHFAEKETGAESWTDLHKVTEILTQAPWLPGWCSSQQISLPSLPSLWSLHRWLQQPGAFKFQQHPKRITKMVCLHLSLASLLSSNGAGH